MNAEGLKRRTKDFAHRWVKLSLALPKGYLGNHVRGQLIRASTSVASNCRATCLSQSKAAFVSKLSIVLEEADESAFWMEFAAEEDLVAQSAVGRLLGEAQELTAIFAAARKTARNHSAEFPSCRLSDENHQ
ncbi:four helix bundle protein [Anaerobaca lacustris]|uniref:Four helix bundle protein n=1 Tax=Anaerobaca lacustris TaxID=3044600 RepID=A0AAW6TXP2_9BACT|nr:four helix bundle protein [Sedimentisphaerales bacterium M17dextr]